MGTLQSCNSLCGIIVESMKSGHTGKMHTHVKTDNEGSYHVLVEDIRLLPDEDTKKEAKHESPEEKELRGVREHVTTLQRRESALKREIQLLNERISVLRDERDSRDDRIAELIAWKQHVQRATRG